MNKSKVESLIGFAVKAGRAVFGLDAIERLRAKGGGAGGGVRLVIYDGGVSQNALKKLNKYDFDKVASKKSVESMAGRANCKIIGLTDAQMAAAVMENLDENFTAVK